MCSFSRTVCSLGYQETREKDRKAAGPWVHAIIANPDLDLETWDGNIWSTDSDFYTEEESDAKMGGVHGAPVFKRKLVTRENGQAVWTDELTDYSSEEVKNLLEKYRQRPREKPQNQLVHLVEEGADSVLLDSGDAEMFMGLTSDIYVQSALYCVGENSVTVVAIVGEGFSAVQQ